MKRITKLEFLELYEKGLVTEVIFVQDRVIGRMLPNRDKEAEVVYVELP